MSEQKYPGDPNKRPDRRGDPNAPRDPNTGSGANNPAGPDYMSGPGSRPRPPAQPNQPDPNAQPPRVNPQPPNARPDWNASTNGYSQQSNYRSDPNAQPPRSAPQPPGYPQNQNSGAGSNYPQDPRYAAPQYPPATPPPSRYPAAQAWAQTGPADRAYMGNPAAVPARRGGCRRYVIVGALIIALLAVLSLVAGCGSYMAIAAGLPSTDQLATSNLSQSTKIYDRNGGILFEVFDPNSTTAGRRTIVPPERMPLVLKQAIVDTEDPSFYTNPGVDWYGIARAIYYDLRYQRVVSGASTITQQLVRNTLITPEPTFQRKIREAVLALEVTRRYSKDQILSMYLNTVYYGNLSYGIQAASQSYFGKDVSQLDLGEASLLAGLPQSPAFYDPCENPDAALTRQQVVLDLMKRFDHVNDQQIQAATAEMDQRLHSDEFSKHCKAPATLNAPHFVNYVLQQLEDKYGQEVVYKGGLQVYTTLDPTMQDIAQQEATRQVSALRANNVKSAALVAANPQTGEIYAMLGSVNFNDKNIDGQVNVATSSRQPGSSIKPINYVTALEKGWTPATTMLDLLTPFPNGNQAPYVPVNYDGKEHGIVNVRTALANSLNIPAVKTLYFVTVKDMIATSEKMGITTFKDPNRYGLALTLGGGEVKLIELTNAYAAFANQGKLMPLTPYLKIVDGQGHVVLDNTQARPQAQQVIDPRYAYLITNILSDNNARAMEFGANSPLKTSRPAFAKTGTTNDFKDNWTLGGTPELVVGVWVGDPRNTAMKNVTGISGAAPIWHNVIERAYKEDKLLNGIASHDFPIPQGLVRATVCNESGLLPTDLCPPDHRHQEIFLDSQAPKDQDNVWVKVKIDKSNGKLANDKCPADIVEEKVFEKMPKDPVLPYDQVVKWANDHGIPQPPTEQSDCTNAPTPEPTPAVIAVKITKPQSGDTVSGTIGIRGTASIPDFDHYVLQAERGGFQPVPIGSHDTPVVDGLLERVDTHIVPDGPYTIRLIAFDKNGNQQEDQVNITVDNTPETPTPKPVTPTPTAIPTGVATPTPTLGPVGFGPGLYQNDSPAIKYVGSWQLRSNPAASGGSFQVSTQPNAAASITVVGATQFTITLFAGPGRGSVRVFVDGAPVGTFDSNGTVAQDVTSQPVPLADNGSHKITIQVIGSKSVAFDYITIQ